MSTSAISSSSLLNMSNSGTSSSSGSSSSGSGSSSTSDDSSLVQPQTITTVSQYGSDLQSVLDRAVEIADVPVQQLQNEEQTNLTQKAALIGLNTDITTFVNDLTSLGNLASSGSLSASSSDSNVTATNTGATNAGSWTISNVQSIATAASAMSGSAYATVNSTQVASSNELTLVVDGKTYPTLQLTTSTNNLNGVAAALNAISGDPVTAVVLTGESGQNYLSVTANNTGAGTVQLFDGANSSGTSLLPSSTSGSDLIFQLDGIPVDQASNVVNAVVPGLTFTFKNPPSSSSVTLSLSTDPSQLSGALNTLVGDYNTLVADIGQQTGTSAGPLQGDMALTNLENYMRQFTSFSGTGAIKSLSDLGISLSDTGQMSFTESTFDALSSSQIQSALSFIGSSTSGLASMTSTFTQLSDPVTGLIQNEENGLDQTDTDLSNQISTMNTQIQNMQTAMSTKLEQADSLIAQLQSQQTMLTDTLTSLNYVLYGQQNTSV